jgi:transcriptional regulator of heat shock response
MGSFKGKRLDTGYPKRFDQELNKQFRKLSLKEQAKRDITASALRNVIRNARHGDNSEVLRQFLKKCRKEQHWVTFLQAWHNEKKGNAHEEINE